MTVSTPLPRGFLARPVAHRALHGPGRPENSRAAVRAAVAGGWGIEIDLQPSADRVPMVFHDGGLARLTAETGPVRERSAGALGAIPLTGGDEGIPTFAEVLEIVAGRVPLLVEIKDQSGTMGPTDGALERAAAEAARGYEGPLAFMSFNPHAVAAVAEAAPGTPRGLVTCAFRPEDWPGVTPDRCAELAAMGDVARVGAAFVSHGHRDLGMPRVAELKAQGLPVLCWTLRSAAEAAAALRVADQITFEGFDPS
ncbi:phosphodiesterase [Rhodovulum sp. 12E13]|nr:phosphodiesterase [Rhodovulum sp. 12E13]